MFDFDIAGEIKARVTMPEVLQHYGFKINRAGFCCCPFHVEHTPSLKAYDGDRGFHCFGCGVSGDVIDFVRRYFGIDFLTACKQLNSDFALGLPLYDSPPTLRMYRAMERRRNAAQQRRERRERLEREFIRWHDEWLRLDAQRIRYAPKTQDEELDPRFVEALHGLDRAAYELDIAEGQLYDFERQNNSDCYN